MEMTLRSLRRLALVLLATTTAAFARAGVSVRVEPVVPGAGRAVLAPPVSGAFTSVSLRPVIGTARAAAADGFVRTPKAAAVQAAPVPASAPSAAAVASNAPFLTGSENGLIHAADVDSALAGLRAASYASHSDVEMLVAHIKAVRPDLPISDRNLFLVRDRETLDRLGIPEDAAGAARIVTDGVREVPIVILVAVKPVGLDRFVEFSVHEAVHLMDDGILRVNHDQLLKHWFAEGWTQKRAVEIANQILGSLGRPRTEGLAYHKEIALVEAFIARHGVEPLERLVRTGSDEGLRAALGDRWDLLASLVEGAASREKRLNAMLGAVSAPAVSAEADAFLRDYVDHPGARAERGAGGLMVPSTPRPRRVLPLVDDGQVKPGPATAPRLSLATRLGQLAWSHHAVAASVVVGWFGWAAMRLSGMEQGAPVLAAALAWVSAQGMIESLRNARRTLDYSIQHSHDIRMRVRYDGSTGDIRGTLGRSGYGHGFDRWESYRSGAVSAAEVVYTRFVGMIFGYMALTVFGVGPGWAYGLAAVAMFGLQDWLRMRAARRRRD